MKKFVIFFIVFIFIAGCAAPAFNPPAGVEDNSVRGKISTALAVGVGVVLADDITGIGVADDWVAIPLLVGLAAIAADQTHGGVANKGGIVIHEGMGATVEMKWQTSGGKCKVEGEIRYGGRKANGISEGNDCKEAIVSLLEILIKKLNEVWDGEVPEKALQGYQNLLDYVSAFLR